MLTENREILINIILGGVLFLFLVIVIFISAIRYQKKLRRHLLERQQLQSQFSQTLLQSQLEIQEQTLQRVGLELHDNLGQVASIIKINLNTLRLADTASAAEKIEDTKVLTRQLIADIKALSVSLGSDRLRQTGLVEALRTEAERLNRTGEFRVRFSAEGMLPSRTDEDKSVILYRMAQEILNNAVKHSCAQNISVELKVTENLFTLAVTDDGTGFDVAAKTRSGGAGLGNLHSRAKMIQASISITSAPGEGTRISIETLL